MPVPPYSPRRVTELAKRYIKPVTVSIREERARDSSGIREVLVAAIGSLDDADLGNTLRELGVLASSLVAIENDTIRDSNSLD
jgi:hypothetical protein